MKIIVVLLAVSASVLGSDDEGFRCIPSSGFILDCNTCSCSVDGTSALCTYKGCLTNEGLITYLNLPKNTESANKKVCKPHSVFKYKCNWCTCSADGTTYSCTEQACGEIIYDIDGSVKSTPYANRVTRSVSKQVCQPRSTFKNYCNTCSCALDGMSFACTRMACDTDIWNPDGSLKIRPDSNRVTDSGIKQVCPPRSTFKNYCNTCTCAPDGMTYACTRMACDKDIWSQDGSLKIPHYSNRVTRSAKQVCPPSSTFLNYCSICTCAPDGMSYACTKTACDKDILNADGSLKIAAQSKRVIRSVCQPFSTFKDYCNTCTCGADGTTYLCTMKACNIDLENSDGSSKVVSVSRRVGRSVPNQVCEPLSQFKDYCNTCGCAADGMSFACTRMECDKEIWNQDGTLKIVPKSHNRLARSVSNQVCEPMTQFKDYCNTCGCAADGMSFICTRMMCDKNIWNKDGSLKPQAQNLLPRSEKSCKPGTTFSPDDCNTCVCNEDGTSQCSFKLCLTTYTEPIERS